MLVRCLTGAAEIRAVVESGHGAGSRFAETVLGIRLLPSRTARQRLDEGGVTGADR